MDETEKPWGESSHHKRSTSEEPMERRLREAEQAVIRVEEQTKTIFHWMEAREASDNLNQEKAEQLSRKIDKLVDSNTELTAMKNKWGGILLALTFMGGAALTISGVLIDWIKQW